MIDLSWLRKDVDGTEFNEVFLILVPHGSSDPMLASLGVFYSREQAEHVLAAARDERARGPQFVDFSTAFVQRYVKG